MLKKKESFVAKTPKVKQNTLPGLQLNLFPEMNDATDIIIWFSDLWQKRQKKYPAKVDELQSLCKRYDILNKQIADLYKMQEEMSNQSSNYWYNNMESRDLESDDEEDLLDKHIDKTNDEMQRIKARKNAIISEIYPEHKLYVELLKKARENHL